MNSLDQLAPRGKSPTNVHVLETWIQQAERKVDIVARRLDWMIASSVVIATLQRVAYMMRQTPKLTTVAAWHRLYTAIRNRIRNPNDMWAIHPHGAGKRRP